MQLMIWTGIVFCITQSAMFSGLNLAFFSISKLRLEIEVAQGNRHAMKVLALRKDSNFLLTTILWGNVGINVLLTLLSHSVMAGIFAFLFSTIIITLLGEIIPQAYFSRHALKMASLMAPGIRLYQILLYPITKSTAILLDKWLGHEAVNYFQESDLEELLRMHMNAGETDIDRVEGKGALNFLTIDDLPLSDQGEIIDPRSIISLAFEDNRPIFPDIDFSPSDDFLKQINASEKKWVIITDSSKEPKMALNSDSFIRDALFKSKGFNPYLYCHRPIIVKNGEATLGEILPRLKVHPQRSNDNVIDNDIILFWGDNKKVITGADILGELLRGIVQMRSKK